MKEERAVFLTKQEWEDIEKDPKWYKVTHTDVDESEPHTFTGVIKAPTEPSQWSKLQESAEHALIITDEKGNCELIKL